MASSFLNTVKPHRSLVTQFVNYSEQPLPTLMVFPYLGQTKRVLLVVLTTWSDLGAEAQM